MPLQSYSSNFTNESINPCLEESHLTGKCLEVNLYDYAKCAAYFENYKQCKKFWNYVSRERMKHGISPKLPTKEERQKILKLKQEGTRVFSASD